MTVVAPVDELAQFWGKSARILVEKIGGVIREAARPLVDLSARADSVRRLADSIAAMQGEADMFGRRRLLLEVDARTRQYRMAPIAYECDVLAMYEVASQETPLLPDVEFSEAVRDMVKREPRLAKGAEAVRKVYTTEHGFAMARSTDLAVTDKVRGLIARAIKAGKTVPQMEEVIASLGDWTRAYAETVFRTNVATAYTAGRFQQAFDPDLSQFVKAFEFTTAGDVDVRRNHAAAEGLIAPTHDPIWDKLAPPLGYNCRCGLRMVDAIELKRRRLIDANGFVGRKFPASYGLARPDAGFGTGRPDRGIYLAGAVG